MSFADRLPLLALSLLIGAAGCSAGFSGASNNQFSIEAPADHVTTSGKLQLSARAFNGSREAVQWTLAGGDDEAGPGSIDENGVYTPPAYLRAANAQVQITAVLNSDSTVRATETITITPAVSVSPQDIALTPGAQTRLYASVAQVGAGSVQWSDSSSLGSFSGSRCSSSHDRFTQCSVLYTAPSSLPADEKDLTLHAALRGTPAVQSSARVLLNSSAATSPLENESPQTGADVLGTSGGNAHDSANQYCCGGTLGALVDIGGEPYVLSNNHVLARTDQANAGESILQPGLLDTDCGYAPSYTVATLSYFPRLQNQSTNVDAAVAQAGSGALDPTGAVLGFGPAANGTIGNAPPARDPEDVARPGTRLPQVVKSGRTTGLTCGSISQIAVDFAVNYNTSCDGSGEAFSKAFTNQIAVEGASFADSGDSGALLADQQTAQPVGLLFAGNSSETFANPIDDVLHSLGEFAAEKNPNNPSVTLVGGDHHAVTCLKYDNATPAQPSRPVPSAAMVEAQEIATRARAGLLSQNRGLLDVAVGISQDSPGEPAIVLYVDSSNPPANIPQVIEGERTLVIPASSSELANGHAPANNGATADLSTLPRGVVDAAVAIKQSYSATLRRDPAIFGVGVGKSLDNPNEAALVVFVNKDQTPRSAPALLGGLRVQYLYQDAPRAFDWKHNAGTDLHHASCRLHSAAADLEQLR